jgi:hypothetical protein
LSSGVLQADNDQVHTSGVLYVALSMSVRLLETDE